MTRNEKLTHMLSLTEEINILTQRIQPHDTGYIHTTINTLRDRISELKNELSDKPHTANFGSGEGLDGVYTKDEMEEWSDMVEDKKEPPMSIH